MALLRRIGYALLIVGVVLSAFPFVFAGSTERQCPEIDSIVYDTVGIHPTGFAITGVDLSRFELLWYDGCNWHNGPLAPLLLGVAGFAAGLVVVGWSARASTTSN